MTAASDSTRCTPGLRGGILLCAALLAPLPLDGQEVESPLSPAGRLRIEFEPAFVSWDTRFGMRLEDGVTVEEDEPLAFDLDDPTGLRLFPGIPDLTAALRQALDDDGYTPFVGISRAEVTKDRTELPIRLDMGVFDWLTVGATVPFVKNRTELTLSFRGDSTSLGISPALTDGGLVAGFLGELDRVVDAVAGRGGALEERTLELADALRSAYNSGALFPTEGSEAGTSLRSRLDELNGELQAAGVAPVAQTVPLAATPLLTTEDLQGLLTDPGRGFGLQPVEDVVGIWELGDIELHAVARLLHGTVRDSAGAPARLRWVVGAGALVRLGTGTMDDPAVVHDQRSGDGQTDIEGRLFANAEAGRWGLRADVRYGVQLSTTLPRRVAPPDVRFPSVANRATVEWTPGDYLAVELGPRYHLNREIAFLAQYRLFDEGRSSYTRTSPLPGLDAGSLNPSKRFTDVDVLARESERTAQHLGFGVVYSSVDAWRAGETGFPFELRLLVRNAVSGRGGQTPKVFRTELRLRLFRRFWGG